MARLLFAGLFLFSHHKLIHDPKPTTVGLTSGDFRGDITVRKPGGSQGDIATAQGRGLITWIKLRTLGQKFGEERLDLHRSNGDNVVAVSDDGMRLVKRHESLDVACIGARYEKLLQVIGFLGRLMHQ